jgi:hypothetical protein
MALHSGAVTTVMLPLCEWKSCSFSLRDEHVLKVSEKKC